MVIMTCCTWCVGVMSVQYSSQYMLSGKPSLTQPPQATVVWTLVRIAMVAGTKIFPPRVMVGMGTLITCAMWVVEWKFTTTTGLPRASAIQFSALSCVVLAHAAGLLAFLAPENWFPFIAMCVLSIPTAVISYRMRLRRAVGDPGYVQIVGRVAYLREINWDSADIVLNARDLGAALHTPCFQAYLCATLSQKGTLNRQGDINQSVDDVSPTPVPHPSSPGNHQKIAIALNRLRQALSVDCGQRSLALHRNLIPLIIPCLDVPEVQSDAIKVLLAVSTIPSVISDLRKHGLRAVINVWVTVRCAEFHRCAGTVLRRIKAGDQIIVYPFQPSNLSLSRVHQCLGGQVVSIPVSRHDVWLVPCPDEDAGSEGRPTARSNVFTPEDPIDAVAAFPPRLLLPTGIVQGALAHCPCLCMPVTVDFNDFHMLVTEEEVDPKRRRSSLHRLGTALKMNTRSLQESTVYEKLNFIKHSWANWWAPPRVHCESDAPIEGGSQSEAAWVETTKATRLWVLFIDEEEGDVISSTTANRGAMDLLRESLNVYYMGYLPQWRADAVKE